MFAILKSKSSDVADDRAYCCHLSNDVESANAFLVGRKDLSSAGRYSLVEVSSLEDLAKAIMMQKEETPEELLADLLKKMEELGLTAENAEKFTKQVRDQSEKAVAEVRSLGIRGMQAVGDGFIAFGDLLRKAAKDDDDE
jgi:hypothetical protein